MIRALVWKEFREQRLLAAASLGISILLPLVIATVGLVADSSPIDYREQIADALRILLIFLVWPLVAASAGASVNLREADAETAGFLLTRPVPRVHVWLAKVGLGLLTVGLVVVFSSQLAQLFDRVVLGRWREIFLALDDVQATTDVARFQAMSLIVFGFAGAVTFSTFVRRQITTALLGAATAAGTVTIVPFFWLVFFSGFGRERAMSLALIQASIVAVVLLAFSLVVFVRRSPLENDTRRRAVTLGGLVFATLVVTTFGLVSANASASPGSAEIRVIEASRRGEFVLVNARQPGAREYEVWTIGFDGSLTRLAPRATSGYGITRDGSQVAYISSRGLWEFPALARSLRLIAPDGSRDRLLTRGALGFNRVPGFSPDGSRLAMPVLRFDEETGDFRNGYRVLSLEAAGSRGRATGGAEIWVDAEGSVARVRGRSPAFSALHVMWSSAGDKLYFVTPEAVIAHDLAAGTDQALVVHDRMELPPGARPMAGDWSESISVRLPRQRLRSGIGRLLPLVKIRSVLGDVDGAIRSVERAAILGVLDTETGEFSVISTGPDEPSGGSPAPDVSPPSRVPCGPVDISSDEMRIVYATCAPGWTSIDAIEIRIHDLVTGLDRVLGSYPSDADLLLSPDGESVVVLADRIERDLERPTIFLGDGVTVALPFEWRPVLWVDDGRILLSRHELRYNDFPRRDPYVTRLPSVIEFGILDVRAGEIESIWP